MCFLHLAGGFVDIGDVALCVIVVGDDVVEFGAVIRRLGAACAIVFHGGHGRAVTSCVVKALAVDKDVSGVGAPIHLQAGEQLGRVGGHFREIVLGVGFPWGEIRAFLRCGFPRYAEWEQQRRQQAEIEDYMFHAFGFYLYNV